MSKHEHELAIKILKRELEELEDELDNAAELDAPRDFLDDAVNEIKSLKSSIAKLKGEEK